MRIILLNFRIFISFLIFICVSCQYLIYFLFSFISIISSNKPINTFLIHPHLLIQLHCSHDHPQTQILIGQMTDKLKIDLIICRKCVFTIFFMFGLLVVIVLEGLELLDSSLGIFDPIKLVFWSKEEHIEEERIAGLFSMGEHFCEGCWDLLVEDLVFRSCFVCVLQCAKRN